MSRRRSGRPSWWPKDEPWPPRRGRHSRSWNRFARRIFWTVLAATFVIVVVPMVVGLLLAVVVGGSTSVVIAIVSWFGIAVVIATVMRSGARTWLPIRSIVDAAGRLADGDYTARASEARSGAASPIVRSFNRMASRLEAAETDRRKLIADVGHELRTPLTLIRGELEAIADGVRPPTPDRIGALLSDVAVMERLLDDLRTLSTAEAGTLEVHREHTDLVTLVGDAVDRFSADADRSSVELGIGDECSELAGDVDPVRLQEVVSNLVRNALRATPAGGSVSVSVEPSAIDGEPAALIEVVDTGRGIPPDRVEGVFDRFHSGPESDGSGLGLTISRDLVEAHGGEISLSSREGSGTKVSVVVPI